MSSKHFFSDPTHLVNTALHACTLLNPSTALDAENKIVYLRPSSAHKPQVSVLTGGGSGHEPSFAAYVGHGLLSAAVAGTIFASPSAEQVRRAILGRVDTSKGVIVVVMNYTGDVLNFGMAVEKARAKGVEVEMVVVGDDVGVGRIKGGKVGRRGISGTVLVQKIVGALAATGASLEVVHKIAKLTAANTISVGASLDHVHVPGRALPDPQSDEILQIEECEVGMGIHNEPGSHRTKFHLVSIVKTMLAQLLDWKDEDRAFIRYTNSDKFVLLINNLGGVSVLEMGGITAEVSAQLQKDYQIEPVRVLCGPYMTSLNGMGFSISLLKLQDTGLPQSMLELLDAPAEATGWASAVRTETWEQGSTKTRDQGPEEKDEHKSSNLTMDPKQATRALKAGLEKLIAAEAEITRFDTVVGDGDCGIGLKRGAEATLGLLEKESLPSDPAIALAKITAVIETSMDGTSGALYAIFLNALSAALYAHTPSQKSPLPVTPATWASCLNSSLSSLSAYTPARPGDRTLIDALEPFVRTLKETGKPAEAAKAAEEGARGTQAMKASLGRSVYVGEGHETVMDPGAWGLAVFLKGLVGGL